MQVAVLGPLGDAGVADPKPLQLAPGDASELPVGEGAYGNFGVLCHGL